MLDFELLDMEISTPLRTEPKTELVDGVIGSDAALFFFLRRGGATGASSDKLFTTELFVLAITSGSCRVTPDSTSTSVVVVTVDVASVAVLGYCDVSFELGVEELTELVESAEFDDCAHSAAGPLIGRPTRPMELILCMLTVSNSITLKGCVVLLEFEEA